MSTLIGSTDTNIQISDLNGIEIFVGNVKAFALTPTPGGAGGVVQQFATISYVDSQTLNDLSL
jgi:hypothetical protein